MCESEKENAFISYQLIIYYIWHITCSVLSTYDCMRISAYLYQRSFNYISTTVSLFKFAKFQIKSPIYAVVVFSFIIVNYCTISIACEVKISALIVPAPSIDAFKLFLFNQRKRLFQWNFEEISVKLFSTLLCFELQF